MKEVNVEEIPASTKGRKAAHKAQVVITVVMSAATIMLMAAAKGQAAKLVLLAATLLYPLLIFANEMDFKYIIRGANPGWRRVLKRATEACIVLAIVIGVYLGR